MSKSTLRPLEFYASVLEFYHECVVIISPHTDNFSFQPAMCSLVA